jgi:hypothetical protein
MLPGISGTLLGRTFLEREIAARLTRHSETPSDQAWLQRWWRRIEKGLGPASSVRAIVDTAALPLLEHVGYRIQRLEPLGAGLAGLASSDDSCIAIRVSPWLSDLEQEWRDTIRAGRVGDAQWGVIFSGRKIRLVDALRTWSRRALEFELATVLRDEHSATALSLVLRAAGMMNGDTLRSLTARSEAYGLDVCAALSAGVVDALTGIFTELEKSPAGRRIDSRATFEQSVTIVYRLLFLLFAESRALVPTWHYVYREAYTIDALCRRALLQPTRKGLWRALQAIGRLAHQGCRAGDLVLTPFNGRLFSPAHTPLAERASVADAAIAQALISLATTPGRTGRERIAYGDLGVEQLGAVYEDVLEYQPASRREAPRLTRTSLDRKTTASFYTPRSITDFLVRRALHPLVAGRSAEQILNLRILDPAMGSGAFLVAACRFLGAAAERALVDEGALTPEPSSDQQIAVRRLVAQRCLFGVDVNPMAVQLARLSLWLATLAADRPLTFLDHHLVCGDSLIGASFLDLARPPFTSGRPAAKARALPLFDLDPTRPMAELVLPTRKRLAVEPDDTPAVVYAKEHALAQLSAEGAPLSRWRDAAHLWCAAWFWSENGNVASLSRGVYHDVRSALLGGIAALNESQHQAIVTHARAVADMHRFFHWELEFPEVFFTATGQRSPDAGFDAVLGNPPWDVLRADTGDQDARARARLDHRAKLRFVRDAGVYRCQGSGHANRYQLFLERSVQLVKDGGRLGLIVPAGLATDQGSADLRRALLDETAIDRLIGFDNRRGIFPIHRDVRFLLVTATKGDPTQHLTCSLGRSDARELDQLPDNSSDDPVGTRGFTLSRRALSSWDPRHLALPWMTRAEDVEIVSTIYGRVPALSSHNGWNVRFGRELNATEDRRHFMTLSPDPKLLPVIEGKHLDPFRVALSKCHSAIPIDRAASLIDSSRSFGRARIAYRDVASASNRLTLIAARLPVGTISTHTVFCSKDTLGGDAQYCLLGLLNSLVANYLVRLRVTTHVTAAVMALLPVPRPSRRVAAFHELAELARALEVTGIPGDGEHYARINALAAQLYGLTREQYEHVVSTFRLLSEDVRAQCLASDRRARQGRFAGPAA